MTDTLILACITDDACAEEQPVDGHATAETVMYVELVPDDPTYKFLVTTFFRDTGENEETIYLTEAEASKLSTAIEGGLAALRVPVIAEDLANAVCADLGEEWQDAHGHLFNAVEVLTNR